MNELQSYALANPMVRADADPAELAAHFRELPNMRVGLTVNY